MALTAEQQAQIEFEKAQALAMADVQSAVQMRDRRMETVPIARDILMENDRNKAVGERGIAASDVTTFADTLLTYINS